MWRSYSTLSLAYFFYYGYLGIIVPFIGIFLDARHYSSAEIGQLIGLVTIARVFGPNLWAGIADRTGKLLLVVRVGSLIALCACLSLLLLQGFWGLVIGFGLSMLFFNAIIPQLEVITLNAVGGDPSRYSYIRLWGSVGFILLSIVSGWLIDKYDTEIIIPASCVVLGCLLLSTLLLRQGNITQHSKDLAGSLWQAIKTQPFALFLLSSICLQLSFGAFYGFFALYMSDLGYSGQQTGWLISLGVAAEVVVFLLAGRWIDRFGLKAVLILCMFSAVVRWWLLAYYADHVSILIFTQCLHALSFGLAHSASMRFIHVHFAKPFHGRAQALYLSLSFGGGGALGNYLSGLMWEQGAGAQQTFVAASVVALGAAVLLFPLAAIERPQST